MVHCQPQIIRVFSKPRLSLIPMVYHDIETLVVLDSHIGHRCAQADPHNLLFLEGTIVFHRIDLWSALGRLTIFRAETFSQTCARIYGFRAHYHLEHGVRTIHYSSTA